MFEGHQVEWMVDDLIDEPFHTKIQSALEQWRAIVDGPPRIARERFGWERNGAQVATTEAIRLQKRSTKRSHPRFASTLPRPIVRSSSFTMSTRASHWPGRQAARVAQTEVGQ